jgi:cytochrome c-type biogenesis protein
MEILLSRLTDALAASMPVAAVAAFTWGVLSIVLSPCHLSSIPLIVAFISEQQSATRTPRAPGAGRGRRATLIALVFSLGILVTIAAIGAVTAALGRMLGDVGPVVNYAVAVVLIALGLHFLGVLPLPWSGPGVHGSGRSGVLAAFVLGLVFGVGVGPCTFAYMAPMLGVTFKVATGSWMRAMTLLLLYGVGHCSVIVLAGGSMDLVQRYLGWSQSSRGVELLRRACGVLVILGGLYLISTAS